MHTIQAAPFLKAGNHNLRAVHVCPKCAKNYVAENGVIYPATYQKGDKAYFGLLMLCSTTCLLQWEGLEVGHA